MLQVLTDFLPVLDNFDRARDSIAPKSEAEEAENAKYSALHADLMAALSELGTEERRPRPKSEPEPEPEACPSLVGRRDGGGRMRVGRLHADEPPPLPYTAGMEKMVVVGEEFDYNNHMAIQQVPSDEYEEGIVCAEMQPGYLCQGKLVRAAYVMVSAGI